MCWESADSNGCVCQTAGHLGGCVCSPQGMAGTGIDQSDIESLSRVGMGAALLQAAAGDSPSASLLSTCLEKAHPDTAREISWIGFRADWGC